MNCSKNGGQTSPFKKFSRIRVNYVYCKDLVNVIQTEWNIQITCTSYNKDQKFFSVIKLEMCPQDTETLIFPPLSQNFQMDRWPKWNKEPFLLLFSCLIEWHWPLILLLQNELYCSLLFYLQLRQPPIPQCEQTDKGKS